MLRTLALSLSLLLLVPACVSIRTSSRDFLSENDSQFSTSSPVDEATQRLMDVLSRRGIHLIDRKELEPGKVLLKFKGTRMVTQEGKYGSAEIGSAYYVHVQPRPEGGTQLSLFGKPTYRGREVCTDHDDGTFFTCEGNIRGLGTPPEMTGREESETIRGVIVELSMEKH
ncbi:hypothetical protein [Vitiosangium sp. GDMCC 1.1324]|uniref:hypothetical protein n=1 Tax=Vitiosangium sp. (strain GDMCC 1.1324) TaxID=2138576 RepID=UPI000D3C8796|nr:hypothetical protein [Vitiosangium sp. GDMCC 1.1324]PTL85912.1 hypothetical protein DAT35_04275 [Vitiosangium sp. GDMCC 1.1324]